MLRPLPRTPVEYFLAGHVVDLAKTGCRIIKSYNQPIASYWYAIEQDRKLLDEYITGYESIWVNAQTISPGDSLSALVKQLDEERQARHVIFLRRGRFAQ